MYQRMPTHFPRAAFAETCKLSISVGGTVVGAKGRKVLEFGGHWFVVVGIKALAASGLLTAEPSVMFGMVYILHGEW